MNSNLWSLFAGGFLSATLLPGSSEALFLWLLADADPTQRWGYWFAVTAGNSLGGLFTWGMGRFVAWRFPARQLEAKHARGLYRLRRWGDKALLLSWLPVIGDPLCFAAGWLNIRWPGAVFYITVGKGLRYALLWGMGG